MEPRPRAGRDLSEERHLQAPIGRGDAVGMPVSPEGLPPHTCRPSCSGENEPITVVNSDNVLFSSSLSSYSCSTSSSCSSSSRVSLNRVARPRTVWFALLLSTLCAQLWSPVAGLPQQWEHGTGPNTTYISQVLNRLTERSKYDKRLRPLYGENPVDVGITIHVSSISAVSEVDMDFTLDFYLRQTWQDPRLAFGKLDIGFEKIKSLTVGVDYLERLWKPDTFFPNEKKSFFHIATSHNSFLRIEPDGRVFTSQRLTVTATCPMDLQLFPMDAQSCKLEIESYGYTTADIDYFWGMRKSDNQESAVAFADFTLPQFKRAGYRVNITKARTASGEYVRLYFEIILKRNLGFYLMNIIIPSVLIVMISWVSFWLNREASPARVGLGVTTVLTITTVITTTNNSMPKVSYVKGLDVFLNFCFVMVFASLVEYAVVSYMNKKLGQRREKKRKRAEAVPQTTEFPMFTNYAPMSPNHNNSSAVAAGAATFNYRSPGLPTAATNAPAPPNVPGNAMTPDCDCRAIPLMQYSQMPLDGSLRPVQVAYGRRRRPTRCCRYVSPSKIDKYSRYMFPSLFITFNVGYWSIMHWLSNSNENQTYVSFE